ncbi:MAG TPA: hypothetical protein DCE78_03425 [Bacteroidetes bacterium]|nr:hypothetical protein [Bacteroidota bacterium]
MSFDSSIVNLKVAFLAIVMVIWGVAEFSMHTFRPNTIQRENRIVTSFKKTTDTIWKTHETLQIETTQLSRHLQTIFLAHQDKDSISTQQNLIDIMESADSSKDWVVTRNNQVFWWSKNVTRDLINEITQNRSVLYTDQLGVYIISTSKFTISNDLWSISSASKIFEIANPDSRFGDVYQSSNASISKLNPTPFYLEGSPDLLPFDHRFSIIRLHADATTGHLALSTLDPEVRNYMDPFLIYTIRSIFFVLVIIILIQIFRLVLPYDNTWRSISLRTLFIIFMGWSALKLEIIAFWVHFLILDSLPDEIGSDENAINFIWLTAMFIPFALLTYRKLSIDRFYDNSTIYSRTSLIIFATGMTFGGLYFLLSEFLGYMSNGLLLDLSVTSLIIKDPLSLIHFIFSAFVSTLVMITIATVSYLFRSIKYHIKTILLLLVAGYLYAYLILVVMYLNELQNPVFESLWVASAFVIILGIISWIHTSKRNEDTISIVKAGLLMALFLFLFSIPSFYWNQQLQLDDLPELIIGSLKYALLWMVTGSLMWAVFNWFSDKKVGIVNSNESVLSGKSDLFYLGSIIVLVCFHIGLSHVMLDQVESKIHSDFNSELRNKQSITPEGYYTLDEFGLPKWNPVTNETLSNKVLDYSIYSSLKESDSDVVLSWETSTRFNQALTAHWTGNLPDYENPVIFKQTNRNFARIFGAQFSDSFILITLFLLFINLSLYVINRFRRSN